MGCLCSKQQHNPSLSRSQQQAPPVLDQLLEKLQKLADNTSSSSGSVASGPVPQDVLDLVDESLQALQGAVKPHSSVASAAQWTVQAVQPHVKSLAAVAAAIKGAIWDVKDGAFLNTDAWQALGGTATAVLSAGSSLSYIGPVFALFGYAIKQWSTCQEVPQEAVDLLQSCRNLLFDLNEAWPHIMPQQQQQQPQQQQRLQRWLQSVAEAAAQCVVVHEKGVLMSFALAHVHIQELASKVTELRDLRQQLSTVMELALAGKADALSDKADVLLADSHLLLTRLLPQYRPVPELEGKEGRDEDVRKLWPQLLSGGGVRGMLLHGMGGVGKSTLATMLAHELQSTGSFPGGVYMVSVQNTAQYTADAQTLLEVQKRLLSGITRQKEPRLTSLEVGAKQMGDELRKIKEQVRGTVRGPVLLVIDNVPEGGSGIGELLPANLQDCLADGSRVLFTSRNKAAQGLRLKVDKYSLSCLGDEASQQVLLAGGVQLNDAQLKVARHFCSGLPLALTLLNRALVAEDDPADLIRDLELCRSFSVDEEDELVSALSFSVERLSEELRTAWLDLTFVHSRSSCCRILLQCSFGKHMLQKLQDRSLIALHEIAQPTWQNTGEPLVDVVVHDVLRRLAEHMSRLQGNSKYVTFDNEQSISLSPAMKETCLSLSAGRASCTISQLPPLGQLRMLRVLKVDNLAAVLTHGTNLQWLDVEDMKESFLRPCTSRQLPHHAAALESNLRILGVANCLQLAEDPLRLICNMKVPQIRCLRLQHWPYTKLPHTLLQAPAMLHLDLSHSSSLEQLPLELGNLVNLRYLNLEGCSITELPASTSGLQRLEWLVCICCRHLRKLPNSVGALQNLRILELTLCSSLQALPDSITQLQLLRVVKLASCSSMVSLPAGFGDLRLTHIAYYDSGVDIPSEWIANWKSSGCEVMESLEDYFRR